MTASTMLQDQRRNQLTSVAFVAGIAAIAAYNWHVRRTHNPEALTRSGVDRTLVHLNDANLPCVSALVAAWNEADNIEEHIESFRRLRYPHKELILCAGGDDQTFERATSFHDDHIRVIRQEPGEGKQQALAKAFRYAAGSVIYLTDADCLFTDHAFEQVLTPIIAGQDEVATGTSHPLARQRGQILPTHLWARDFAVTSTAPEYTEGLLGRNAAITRAALMRAGGLDFDAPTGTDYQLAKRLLSHGLKIRFVPESSVPSTYPATFQDYRNRQSRWLRNLLLFGPDYQARSDVVATTKTLLLAIAMTTLPLFGLVLGRVPVLVWVALMMHSVMARLRYMERLDRVEPGVTPGAYSVLVVPLTFLDYLVSALPVVELISKRKRKRW
jgi:cellulose synthase/poly-beta-1,6-N-acetylglucosamine synthase-like glycosyltransferase